MTTVRRDARLAAAFGAPIGFLGGLIGLGGAEFRLPVLVGVMGYPARRAVPLNLAVSVFTVVAAAATRLILGGSAAFDRIGAVLLVVLALMGGAVIGAYAGARAAGRISDRRLHQVICVLLVGIGLLLLAEAFSRWEAQALVHGPAQVAVAGAVLGVLIGVVSSLLGVAGGELIIPTLILVFGLDVKLAGTASLLISLPAMLVGIARHHRNAAFAERADVTQLVLPMGAASVLGAIAGGVAVAHVPSGAVKLGLGVLLIVSAIKTFTADRGTPSP